MKKLMFAVAAIAAGAVFAEGEITSQNIVGYEQINSKGVQNPTIGVVFTPVNGDSSVKLGSLKMQAVEDEEFMDVEGECIMKLTTEGAGQDPDAKYTYLSKEYVDAAFSGEPEYDEMLGYVGWWLYEDGSWYIGEEGYNKDDVDVNVGEAFLGELFTTHTLYITPSGEVPTVPTYASSGMLQNPYLCNYLPVDVALSNVVVTAVEDDEFMDVEGECIMKLTTEGAGQDPDNKYTYLSKEYVDAAFSGEPEYDEMLGYVGWWLYEDGSWYIGEEGYNMGDKVWEAGTGLLGELFTTHTLHFNFPSTLDVK